jgi:FKBP-type peptidyl-prolyl cis-trans isomerase SlyD
MKISENKVVTLTYELKVQDETGEHVLVETAEKEHPMVFLFGAGGLPDKFEEYLQGKEAGEDFKFKLEAEEGYGHPDENAIVSIPKAVFEIDGKIDEEMLKVGNFLPMSDAEGNQLQGKVEDISETEVKMNFNHPLAGMAMYFEGKVEDVRDATSEEIAHGHVHGAGGHHH